MCTAALKKFEAIKQLVLDLKKEKDELVPVIEKLRNEVIEEKSKMDELLFKRDEKSKSLMEQEELLTSIEQEVSKLQQEYDHLLRPLEADLKEKRRRVFALRVNDLLQAKTLKAGTPPIRLLVMGLCIILEVHPDKGPGDKVGHKASHSLIMS